MRLTSTARRTVKSCSPCWRLLELELLLMYPPGLELTRTVTRVGLMTREAGQGEVAEVAGLTLLEREVVMQAQGKAMFTPGR